MPPLSGGASSTTFTDFVGLHLRRLDIRIAPLPRPLAGAAFGLTHGAGCCLLPSFLGSDCDILRSQPLKDKNRVTTVRIHYFDLDVQTS